MGFAPTTFRNQILVHPATPIMARPVVAPPAPTPAAPAPALVQARAPVAMPMQAMVLRSTTVATVNPAMLRFQNPRLRPILMFRGVPRASLALPTLVSPVSAPDDSTLFEEPQDASLRHYLPRYAIGATNGPNGRVKWVSLTATDQGVALAVHLAETTDPAITAANTRVDADTRYFLSAVVAGRQVDWDLSLAAANDGASLKLGLSITDFASRDDLYTAMTDASAAAKLFIRRSLPLAEPMPANAQLYHAATVAIDSVIPFTFNRDLDTAVFAAAGTAPTGPAKAWNIVAANWKGRRHTYYQSTTQPDAVYFLPDSFKVMRQDQAPHAPALSVATSGNDAASVVLTLSYLAQPVWDPERIADAATTLQPLLGLSAPPQLALFEAADAKLMLNVPGADTGGSSLSEQDDAIVDIAGGVRGAVCLGLEAFRQVYDALFDQVSQLLAGEVRIAVEGNLTAIPFIARAGDFAGDVLAISSTIDSQNGKLIATIGNAIESPIRIDALDGSILKGGATIPSKLNGVQPALPLTLPPAPTDGSDPQIVTATLGTAQSGVLVDAAANLLGTLFGGGKAHVGDAVLGAAGGTLADTLDQSCAPLLDLSHVHVLPDPAAIWRAIMQDQSLGPVNRTVTLRTLAAMLTPPSPPPPDATLAIQAVFESGQTATFDASQTPDGAGFLNQTIRLSVPIDSFVLGNADTSGYRYRIDRVTPSGTKTGDWTRDNRDVLFVTAA